MVNIMIPFCQDNSLPWGNIFPYFLCYFCIWIIDSFSSIFYHHNQVIIHQVHWMCIVIHIFHKPSPFLNNYLILSTDSIIPWIALPNKCSFLFFTIHLPPVEEGEFLLYIMLNIPIPAMIVNRCLLYVFVRVELRFPLYLPPTAVLGTAFAIFPICRLSQRYTCDCIRTFFHL